MQCRLRILVLILLLGSIVLGQVEAWSGWDGLDEAQRAALLEELNTWADEPLHLRTLTRRQLGELPVSTTTQNVVWDYLQSHPQIRSLDFLDSLMLDSWDYMVLSAAIATDDGGRDQRYRLRMSTRSNQPDERYRQNINLQFNRLSLSAMIQRESEAISFHSYLTGGAVYALPKKYGRLYLGNYRVDSGYGLTFGQSAFVSGSGLNQVYPRLRQRVRIHQSAQMYGYFTGIAWQREWSTLQLLIHLSQNQIPGKIIDGEYVPFPTSSAVNVVYRSARTMGVSLQYMGEEALKVQIHLGSDHLADQWDLPAEVSIAWEHSYLRMAYGAAWWGGDTLSQLFSVRLDGERISSALGFWKIGGQRKLRYRLSEPIIAMQAVNNQGAALGIRYHPGNGVSMEFIAWLRTDVMPIDLQDNAFKRGHESRLTWKNGNVFWRQQWTTGEGSLHKVGIQIHQQQRKEFRLVEFFKLAYQDGMFGGLAGLRWRYRLPGWQVNAGLVRYLAKAYAVRQYAYESGVSSAFSVPLYYGDGVRMYTVIGVLDSFWKLEFQFGQWREFKM
ncbi:MAG: hypothetical protein K9N11_10060, partial [Lentisphaeria bacterium]|nr:hypothetical protein [Lentisphaeria bacterium]